MRVHILSDLHQEFGEIDVPEVACDCVILAGDVSTKLNGLKWIRTRFPSVPVIYLCGNHEFYGEKLPRVTEKLRLECQGTNVHFLENDAVELGGYWFFGCTLWTDLALHGDWHVGATEAGELMNDYKRVRNSDKGYRHLTPQGYPHAASAFCRGHEGISGVPCCGEDGRSHASCAIDAFIAGAPAVEAAELRLRLTPR